MNKVKSFLSLTLALVMVLGGLFTFGAVETSAASYPNPCTADKPCVSAIQ